MIDLEALAETMRTAIAPADGTGLQWLTSVGRAPKEGG